MTNEEKKKRNFYENDLCDLCKSSEETVMHVLRDCTIARQELRGPLASVLQFFQEDMNGVEKLRESLSC
ncbi:Reverse transcriptase zinc-binding domain [Dillenia turbinata]|uniref:Reverse transcriptase zinc-binding domain n=1 Tax=Dillenia turbinata TaxID=194707 RepID=A0AAN8VXL1_9MAGN